MKPLSLVLHDIIADLAPIDGVSIGRVDDKATWTIAFRDAATDAERASAFAALAAFDPFAPTPAAIIAERTRRLALGFDYDFGDARGVHHIGTTDADMVGWREVTDYANALIDLGDTATTIAIVTDTGPATVTAPEWQAVMLQAAVARQGIWAKSFELQAMSPIPADYADDARWS
jgi:hypothetical protein